MAQRSNPQPPESSLHLSQNPLENDLILSLIFAHSSVQDLWAFRQVCSKWLEVSLTRWKKQVVVKTTTVNNMLASHINIDEFYNNYYTPGARPFVNMKWRYDYLPLSPNFMMCFEPLIYLELSSCTIRGATSLLQLLNHLPLLQTLKLTEITIREEVPTLSDADAAKSFQQHRNLTSFEMSISPLQMKDILTYSPHQPPIPFFETVFPRLQNLEYIKLKSKDPPRSLDFHSWIGRLQPEALPKLRTLDVVELDDIIIVHEKFSSHFGCSVEDLALDITNLKLENLVGGNLNCKFKRLRLSVTPYEYGVYMEGFLVNGNITSFPRLQELSLEMGKSLGFEFLQSVATPELRKLQLGNYRISNSAAENLEDCIPDVSLRPGLVLNSVKILKVKFLMEYLNRRELLIFCKAMPQVEEVEMHLTNKTFPIACKFWKELRSLRVLGLRECALGESAVDDQAITGMTKRMKMTKAGNITNLQNLKYFALEASKIQVNLTDVSVTHGFAKIKGLQFLEFCTDSVSSEAKQILQDSIKMVRETPPAPDKTPEEIAYDSHIRQRDFGQEILSGLF